MRVLVLGARGQVGWELLRALAPVGDVVGVGRAECDLGDESALRNLLRAQQPEVVVNAAAYTAVDRAETEPELAAQVNTRVPAVLGEEVLRWKGAVVHYSTDYVFSGNAPEAYREDDEMGPLGVYGKTKWAGEQALRATGVRHLILRTSWVYGQQGQNFLKTMLRLAQEREELRVVADQFGIPTAASLIADGTAHLLRHLQQGRSEAWGTYHLSAQGRTTWHAFACEVLRVAQEEGVVLKVGPEQVQAIPTEAYPTPAKRPANSELDTQKLRDTFGLHLPPWQAGVRQVVQALVRR